MYPNNSQHWGPLRKQAAESAVASTALERVAISGSFENCERGIDLSAVTGCRATRSITIRSFVHTRDKDAARSQVVAGVAWRPPAHHTTGCKPSLLSRYPCPRLKPGKGEREAGGPRAITARTARPHDFPVVLISTCRRLRTNRTMNCAMIFREYRAGKVMDEKSVRDCVREK